MLFFDTNEASKRSKSGERIMEGVISFLEDVGEVEVSSTPLMTGDIMFYSYSDRTRRFSAPVGLELKVCPSDLLSSLSDGRLMRQLPRLLEEYEVAYLVLLGSPLEANWTTGMVREKRGSKWVDSSWGLHNVNALLTKFEMAGGHVRFVQDDLHLCAFLLSTYRYLRKQDHQTETFTRRKSPQVFREWTQLSNPVAEIYERAVDEEGRGIGIQRAVALSEKYALPGNLARALDRGNINWRDIADIKLPNGKRFGPVNAKKVVRWFE